MRIESPCAFRWRALVAGAASFAWTGVSAELPQDHYWAVLEYFYPTISSTVHMDAAATARTGTTISLEDDLDLSGRKGTPYTNLGLRLGETWRLELEYYALKRSASRTTARQIDWGDSTFPAGATLSSTFDSTIYRVTGGWSFVKTPETEAGIGFGLHVTDFMTLLSGQGSGPNGLGFQTEVHRQLVPLPTLGGFGTWTVTPRLALRGRVDYLSFSYDDYDGSLSNTMVLVEWRFSQHFGAGAGYRYVGYKLAVKRSDFPIDMRYVFKGPTIFVNAAF
jgi:hypothetical protein